MDELTISYGLLAPKSCASTDCHILPISKILYPSGQSEFFLTCGRDGSIIKHKCDFNGDSIKRKRMQVHSDWVSDMIQVDENKFITVSYDFSIVLLTLHEDELDTWEMKIIGDHDDYIKNVVEIPASNGEFLFATGGLDKKVKVWVLENDEATLIHEYDNSQIDDTGSIYALKSVDSDFSGPFNLVAGDCDGNIIFYSTSTKTEFLRIPKAHETNIKLISLVDNCTRLVTASSDGYISVWDLSKPKENFPRLATFKWDCSVWVIKGSNLNQLYIADCKGRINQADLSFNDNPRIGQVFGPDDETNNKKKKNGGITDVMILPNDVLMFSKSTDSNLCRLDLRSGSLKITEGGYALTKSSLLTNRRHVITENSKGEIQRWDIVICELVNTFDSSEGNFDEVVSKYTSKEILSHWCSVSVKVGMLFVKLNPRVFNTEVYGSALEDYKFVNEVQLSSDERYNLGKIVVNSLFNEFLSYEAQKDKLFRKQLISKKKDTMFYHREGSATPATIHESDGVSRSKEKRKRSAFYRFTSTTPSSESGLGSFSAPNTPFFTAEGSELPVEEQALLPPPANPNTSTEKATGESSNVLGPPMIKTSEGRTMSSGSLIGRKLRIFRTYSTTSRPNNGTASAGDTLATTSDIEDPLTEDENAHETIVWNQSFNTENATLQQTLDLATAKLKGMDFSPNSSDTAMIHNQDETKNKLETMSDYIEQLRDSYIQQINSNHSSLKLLTRKSPETKIIRDTASPIVRVRSGVLLVVHNWKKNSCGPTALFSSYLPASRALDDDSSPNSMENDDDDEDSQSNEDEKLFKYEQVDNDCGNGMSKRQIFEDLERNLPYWFAKILLCDRVITKQQPKLNFIISPWQNNDQSPSPTAQVHQHQQQHQHQHHRLRFGRSKGTESPLANSELPKISDSNMKLLAPAMIKVKKIKVYIVDRFESKTPEMKSKMDPSEWLEILCKNQVLDNDMTLGTVRTLYWKSQGDILFEYRRKATDISTMPLGPEPNHNK